MHPTECATLVTADEGRMRTDIAELTGLGGEAGAVELHRDSARPTRSP